MLFYFRQNLPTFRIKAPNNDEIKLSDTKKLTIVSEKSRTSDKETFNENVLSDENGHQNYARNPVQVRDTVDINNKNKSTKDIMTMNEVKRKIQEKRQNNPISNKKENELKRKQEKDYSK